MLKLTNGVNARNTVTVYLLPADLMAASGLAADESGEQSGSAAQGQPLPDCR
jgi:hypothetical protein